jgi:hypothetical protein
MQRLLRVRALQYAAFVLAAGLAGCGGGDDAAPVAATPSAPAPAPGPAPSPAPEPPPQPTAATLSGTVATGAALDGAAVAITDRTGANACSNAPLTADATGAYQCTLAATAAAPLLLVATDPAGLRDPLVSLSTSLPGAGQDATVNLSPLTTAIATLLAPNRDVFAFVRDPAVLAAVDAPAYAATRANVVRQLADVLTSLGLDPATFDPVSTAFVGGTNTGADQLLDQVRVVFENGSPVLSNVLTPAAAPVPMATSTTNEPPRVAASAATGFSVAELDIFKTKFEACFAVPAGNRESAEACDGIVVDDAPANLTGGATFLNRGFTASEFFGGLMAASDMDGARFNRPVLMSYNPGTNGRAVAVINLKFTDKNGVGDNRILAAVKYPGTETAARPSAWWLQGNQRAVNTYVRPAIRLQEQTLAEAFQAQYDVGTSRYQTGLDIFIARSGFGPNSAGLRYARVKGPGLPTAGLVFADPRGLPQNWMSILNATGTIPVDEQVTTTSNNIFYLQRSRGLTGADAFAIRPNPNIAGPTPNFNQWAHPAMYGETPSADWRFDLSRVPAGSRYTFELFYAASPSDPTEATPSRTVTASMDIPVVPAAFAATQSWHEIPAATRALASAGAPAAQTLNLAWTINPFAERVESINVYSFGSAVINSPSTVVPKGASSQTATAADGKQFPALTTDYRVGRTLQWRYKMLDGSYKDQTVQFQ